MGCDIIVIGGSAGALQPVIQIVRGLPSSLPAAVFVALHTSPETPGMLPRLLGNGSTMSAAYAVDGEPIRHGHVFIAPPDHHLILEEGRVRIARGPRENGFRPAVDPLFRTAAEHYGRRVVGIVLSGGLDDGANGLGAVKRRGGVAIVQHLDEAFVRSMPLAAIRQVEVDHVVPAAEMIGIVVRLAEDGSQQERTTMTTTKKKPDRAVRGVKALVDGSLPGPPSGFTCPECGGALWELQDGEQLRFACHVGHAYSPETLLNGKAAMLEPVLWTALRALEENGAFLRRMADRARDQGLVNIAHGYSERAVDIERRADVVRGVLVDQPEPMREAAELTREANELVARAALSDADGTVAEERTGSRKRRGRSR
jgi:two-component system, chemotaxis family, protein-glutamate methylesterase/glutaminase